MTISDMRVIRGTAAFLIVLMLGACGQNRSTVLLSSPSPPGVTPSAAPSASAGAQSPSARPSPSPDMSAARLVIDDYNKNQVRLARLNAADTATVTGAFDGVVAGQVMVVNGRSLLALSANGSVRTLGHLAGEPVWIGSGTVVVNPSLNQWLYTLTDTSLTSSIHLGSPAGDRQITSIPSPDGGSYYQPYAWNSSGVYVVQEVTGIGGAGPYVEPHFLLARLDLSSGHLTEISPSCTAERVLDDGTLLCRTRTGGLEVRPPSAASHVVQITGTANEAFIRLTLTADEARFVATRSGNNQMIVGGLSGSTVTLFGPADFYPDAWLPDGRLVAEHFCFPQDPCSQPQTGTYIVSADGKSSTLFYRLASGVYVVAAI